MGRLLVLSTICVLIDTYRNIKQIVYRRKFALKLESRISYGYINGQAN